MPVPAVGPIRPGRLLQHGTVLAWIDALETHMVMVSPHPSSGLGHETQLGTMTVARGYRYTLVKGSLVR